MFAVSYKDLSHPQLRDAIEYLGKIPLEIKTSWNIARLARKIAHAQKGFQDELQIIMKAYVRAEDGKFQFRKDENGEPVKGEWDFTDRDAFDKAYVGLLESMVDIESFRLKASEINIKIPAEILIPLEAFLEDDLSNPLP